MIKITNLSKKYRKNTIFSNFSHEFPETGLVCLVGESGSGKSTLFNIISGIDVEYKGSVKINGVELRNLSETEKANFRIKRIGYVFQNFNLLNLDTVFSNVLLPLETANYAKPFIHKKRVMGALELVGVKHLSNQRINKLSGGEKQRVAIARALINEPNVILCDEPTGALDEKNSKEIFNLLKVLSKQTLVIIATHDTESVKNIADQILEIKDKTIFVKNKKPKIIESKITLIGKGKEKKKPNVSLLFKIRFAYQKLKAKKFRSLIMNFILSISLTGIGLSLLISDSVSSKVEDAFKSILNGNYLILSNKNNNQNTFSTVYSASYDNTFKIYEKYQYLIDGIGVNYLVNFEDFFKDENDFFIDTSNKRIPFPSLSARNINEFRWINDDSSIYYPYGFETLDDDQIVLGLSFEDMTNLCYLLQIQRNFTSLGHYIYEKGLFMSLSVRNSYWQYDDEQLLQIMAVCETSKTCILHTNLLWNEIVFEEMMRLPSDDDNIHEFPWELYKIYYLKPKTDVSMFLDASLYDESLYDYVFERTNYKYNSSLCKANEVCEDNRLYVYSVDKGGIDCSVINEFRAVHKDFDSYYFTSDYGYSSYGSNLFSGFSRNVFVSLNESLIDQAIDADTQVKDESNVELKLPKGVVQGNYLMAIGNGLKFSTNFSKLLAGRKPVNLNEIVVSKGLADTIGKSTDIIGKYMEFSGEIEENYDSEGLINKEYGRSKLLIVGVVDEEKNYLYHSAHWTIDFFRDKLGVSSFSLIPTSIVLEFKTQEEAKSAKRDFERISPNYKIESPIDDLRSNIDSTLEYANIILNVFSILASSISILLLGTTVMLTVIENKHEIKLLKLLGINNYDINTCFVVQSIIQGLISLLISSIELIFMDFLLSKSLGERLGISLAFSLNTRPIFAIFILGLVMPLFVSSAMLLILNRKKRTKV